MQIQFFYVFTEQISFNIELKKYNFWMNENNTNW